MARRLIIGRGLKCYRSKGERESFNEGVREGWLAAMSEIKRKMAGTFAAAEDRTR